MLPLKSTVGGPIPGYAVHAHGSFPGPAVCVAGRSRLRNFDGLVSAQTTVRCAVWPAVAVFDQQEIPTNEPSPSRKGVILLREVDRQGGRASGFCPSGNHLRSSHAERVLMSMDETQTTQNAVRVCNCVDFCPGGSVERKPLSMIGA